MMETIGKVVLYISICSPLAVLFAGKSDKALLWWYAAAALFSDVSGLISMLLHFRIPGHGNLFMILELCFITTYYRRVFDRRILFNMLCLLLVCFFIVHQLFLRPYDASVPYSRYRVDLTAGALFYLLYIMLAIAGFYKLVTGPLIDNILKSELFWVNVTFLVYASGVFFMFVFAETIRKQDVALGAMLWSTLFCGLNITKNILLAKALYVHHESLKS